MMRLFRMGLVCLVALAALSRLAVAQTAAPSLMDPRTFSLGVAGSFEVRKEADEAAENSGAVSVLLARPLSDFALVARGTYDFTQGAARVSPGVQYRALKVGALGFALQLTYDFYAYHDIPKYPNEWVASVVGSVPLGKRFVASGVEGYTLDNHDLKTSVLLSLVLHTARNP